MSTENIANLVPSTELDAINAMLSINGESPVLSLVDPVPAHVDFALQLIRRISRGLQSRGWHFNTVRNTVLTRDPNNGFSIATPANALRVRKTVRDDQITFDFSDRAGFLWDNLTNSDSFDADQYVNGVWVDIVYALDFLHLPEPARQLIFIMAGRRYQEETFGNPELSGFVEKDEALALQNLIDSEGLIEQTNILFNTKDQLRANQIFDAVSKQVQSEGWHFNTRKCVYIIPDLTAGTALLPLCTLRAWKSDRPSQRCFNWAHRGNYLFDVKNNTYVFDPTTLENGKLYVDIIENLSREELPNDALTYITIKAARQMQPQKQVGSAPSGYTEKDEFWARKVLIDSQGLIEDDNLMVNMSVYRSMFGRQSIYGDGNLGQHGYENS